MTSSVIQIEKDRSSTEERKEKKSSRSYEEKEKEKLYTAA
jgi:hypothetical protein